jgi:hypothetical protein
VPHAREALQLVPSSIEVRVPRKHLAERHTDLCAPTLEVYGLSPEILVLLNDDGLATSVVVEIAVECLRLIGTAVAGIEDLIPVPIAGSCALRGLARFVVHSRYFGHG